MRIAKLPCSDLERCWKPRLDCACLGARAANEGGVIDEAARMALRRGLYLGMLIIADKLPLLGTGAKSGQPG